MMPPTVCHHESQRRQHEQPEPPCRPGAVAAALIFPAAAQNVKVTPLGGIDGEFCPQDRALVFEDPNGARIL
jgi:hypothetical protein